MENQLQIIVSESGLEPTKAKYILEKFQDYFQIASEWEAKARALVVTNERQAAEMEMARTGRLFLREKRIAIENARKTLKEQSLREGKAIDGIANVLKALIVPIEEYLEKQEKFIEIQEEKKREAKRLEIEARMAEEERVAAEKAAAEQERVRAENEKLKREVEEKERQIALERKKQEQLLAKERAAADAGRKAQEALLAKEKAKAEKERKEQEERIALARTGAAEEKRRADEKLRKEKIASQEKIEAERKERARLEELLKNQVECPKCHHKFQIK